MTIGIQLKLAFELPRQSHQIGVLDQIATQAINTTQRKKQ